MPPRAGHADLVEVQKPQTIRHESVHPVGIEGQHFRQGVRVLEQLAGGQRFGVGQQLLGGHGDAARGPALGDVPVGGVVDLAVVSPPVAVGDLARCGHALDERRRLEAQGIEDPRLVQLAQRLAGRLFEDHAQQDVAGVAVLPHAFRAGREVRRPIVDGILHQFCGRVALLQLGRVVGSSADDRIAIVPDASGVLGQLTQGHLLAVGKPGRPVGKPGRERVVQRQHALFLQLQQQDDGEGLAVAADLQPVTDLHGCAFFQAGDAGGLQVATVRRVHQQDQPRRMRLPGQRPRCRTCACTNSSSWATTASGNAPGVCGANSSSPKTSPSSL